MFHHLSSPSKFLYEAQRVIVQSGAIILIEPSTSVMARIIYPNLFATEDYSLKFGSQSVLSEEWYSAKPNQALSYAAFKLERDRFANQFSGFGVPKLFHLPSGIRYLLSGGLNFRPLLGPRTMKLIQSIEKTTIGSAILRQLSLHWMIVIRRRANQSMATSK